MNNTTDTQAPATAALRDVPSMLLPMADRTLLVPGVSVAEIVNYSYAECPEDAPEWFLGNIIWRKLSVPLVSFEMLNGQPMPRMGSQRRIAVLNNTGVSEALPFIAIPIQGIPSLLRVTPAELADVEDVDLSPAERAAARISTGETVLIPDVSVLERACRDYLQAH